MEGYTKLKKVIIKEACEETRLELRLCPPGDDFYSNGSPKRYSLFARFPFVAFTFFMWYTCNMHNLKDL